MFKLFVFSTLLVYVHNVHGHGRLMDPPSRASMWRVGFNTPPDYEDNQGFCGVFMTQWAQNDGKCGICGDNWSDDVKQHETPNKYATGTIAAEYEPNQQIDITVDITANHMGHFTFRLCPADTNTSDPDQECFDANVLKVLPQMGDRYVLPSTETKEFTARVQLPDIECDRCVLQWTYTAGNNWGWCEDGSGGLGCGPQETFRACSDIRIKSGQSSGLIRTTFVESIGIEETAENTVETVSVESKPRLDNTYSQCHGVGAWAAVPGINDWCTSNCFNTPRFCPASHCICLA